MLLNRAACAGSLYVLMVDPSADPFVGCESLFFSPLAKKKSLSLRIGPPTWAPIWSGSKVAIGLSIASPWACGTLLPM